MTTIPELCAELRRLRAAVDLHKPQSNEREHAWDVAEAFAATAAEPLCAEVERLSEEEASWREALNAAVDATNHVRAKLDRLVAAVETCNWTHIDAAIADARSEP